MPPADDLRWALEAFDDGRDRLIAHYRAYYRGKHRLAFATPKFRQAFGDVFREFADNLCPVPIEALDERLRFRAFTVRDDDGEDSPLAQAANLLWRRNRMATRAPSVHRGAFVTGDGFVAVGPTRSGIAQLVPQAAENVRLRYTDGDASAPDQLGVVDLAAKRWRETVGHDPDTGKPTRRCRLTVYRAGSIDRWEAAEDSAGAAPRSPRAWKPLDGDPEQLEQRVPGDRVPIFHLPNAADDVGDYGTSELRDVIPLQDALNKTIADLLVGGEFHALPQRWATGVLEELGPDGEKIEERARDLYRRMFTVGDPNAKLGQFEAADLRQLLEVAEAFRIELARIAGLPLWYVVPSMTGQPPSGEALKVGEKRHVAKAERRATDFGAAWADAVAYAMSLTRGMQRPPAGALEATWENPATPDAKGAAETAIVKQQAGVSRRRAMQEEFGYTDRELDTNDLERDLEEQAAAQAEARAISQGRGLVGLG